MILMLIAKERYSIGKGTGNDPVASDLLLSHPRAGERA